MCYVCYVQVELTTLYLFTDELFVLILRKRACSEWAWLEFLNSTKSSIDRNMASKAIKPVSISEAVLDDLAR